MLPAGCNCKMAFCNGFRPPVPPTATTPASLGCCSHATRWYADILCNILWQRLVHFMALIDRPPANNPSLPPPFFHLKSDGLHNPTSVALCLQLLCANTWQLSFVSLAISLTAVTLQAGEDCCNALRADELENVQPGLADTWLRAYKSTAITKLQREAQ